MLTKVNYLLAACSHRIGWAKMAPPAKRILRLHLRELAKTNTQDLAQITILRALPLERDGSTEEKRKAANYYWNIDQFKDSFKCPVVVMDVKDVCFSYSSWLQAVMKYQKQFSHSILIEDDYYPSHPNFIDILLTLHKEKLPKGGYLNSFTVHHAAVCNGIVDNKTFLKGIKKYKDPITECSKGQGFFGHTFFDGQLADYTDKYRCLFATHKEIVEETHDASRNFKQDIFRPIQYLATGEKDFGKIIA